MGGIQKRIYLVEHPQGLDASQKRQRIAQDTGGYIKHPDPKHGMWYREPKHQPNSYQKDIWRAIPKRQMEDKTEGYGSSRKPGFSSSSSSDRLTEEQENEIAENIYDWWISGKSYKQWYAEKFQQLKLDFGEF